MQVHLEVADDKELRKAVRDLIRGQVTSILAGEGLSEMVAQAIERKIVSKNYNIDGMVNTTVNDLVRGKIQNNTTYFLEPKSYIKNAIAEIVESQVKLLVNQEFIEKIARETDQNHLKSLLNVK